MEKTKLRYEVPKAETFVVRFEGVIMTLSNSVNTKNRTQYLMCEDDEYDYEDL